MSYETFQVFVDIFDEIIVSQVQEPFNRFGTQFDDIYNLETNKITPNWRASGSQQPIGRPFLFFCNHTIVEEFIYNQK